MFWMQGSFNVQFYFSLRRVRHRIKRYYPGIAYDVVRRACGLCRIVTRLRCQVPRFAWHLFRGEWGSFRHGGASLLPPIDGPHYSL